MGKRWATLFYLDVGYLRLVVASLGNSIGSFQKGSVLPCCSSFFEILCHLAFLKYKSLVEIRERDFHVYDLSCKSFVLHSLAVKIVFLLENCLILHFLQPLSKCRDQETP
jgi:hypothetical protein